MKYITYILVVIACTLTLGYVFWQQEVKYSLPTPIPEDLKEVNPGDTVQVSTLPFTLHEKRPTFLHFFNQACPCSRFNASEFQRMVLKYKDKVNFYAVLETQDQSEDEISDFIKKYDLGIPVHLDPSGSIAQSMGVYATPQAVIVSPDSTVYYKGNYNRARYCVSRNTKFAELALQAYLNNEPPPAFGPLASVAYGCSLPTDEGADKQGISFIF